MAFPKQQNRRLVIDGETYVLYLKRNEAWMGPKHIAIRHCHYPQGQLLLLDMYAFEFEIRPLFVRNAILFALSNGWEPREKATLLYLGFDNIQFVLLPRGEQYTHVFQWPPSVPRPQQTTES